MELTRLCRRAVIRQPAVLGVSARRPPFTRDKPVYPRSARPVPRLLMSAVVSPLFRRGAIYQTVTFLRGIATFRPPPVPPQVPPPRSVGDSGHFLPSPRELSCVGCSRLKRTWRQHVRRHGRRRL
ncbi:Hypothetical protein NTJ_04367 [Nesidiocoris tenuis]|uniref:C2H2-type domain-containing protein n=1 Tax=Nesidiocoris tenuis TaxID=355587 RepID=A0ABN7AK50_9HEMI|nr:Hypothetical protein NTJ_04367 [Nesidiocoris tenuis]